MKRRFIAAVGLAGIAGALIVVPLARGDAPAGAGELYQTDNWRTEKHVPVIQCPDEFVAGETTAVTVSVGEGIPHPNTTEHHIRWIRLYVLPEDGTFAYEIGHFEFNAHGESTQGADTGTLYTRPKVTVEFRTGVPGVLYATAFCNIHGLWENSKEIGISE